MQTNRKTDSVRIVNVNVWFGLETRGIFKFAEYEKPARRRLRFQYLAAHFDREEARRNDFIFLSYHFKPDMIKKTELVFDEPRDGVFVSDHFGLAVVLAGIP